MNNKNLFTLFSFALILSILGSCSKNTNYNQVEVKPIKDDLSVIFLLGDGMGFAQLTAAWHQNQFLHMQNFPYTGFVLTHSTNKFVTESGAANTAMMGGYKTKYGFLGVDIYENPQESIYEYLKKKNYKTGIITTAHLTDASLAALYTHRTNRYEFEDIALDYYHQQADFAVAGGQDHFDKREDQQNLLSNMQNQGVEIFHSLEDIQNIGKTPALGMLYAGRPPYLLDGRSDYLYQASEKALQLFDNEAFFLFIEGAHIDLGGHSNSIEHQITEIIEFDNVVGMALDYAKRRDNVLVIVVSDHESGGLTLLQGEGMEYIPNYPRDEHSGVMVPIFSYGPGAERFTGIQNNSDVYHHLKDLVDYHINP